MIEIIEGMGVGSGKTYFTVKNLIDHWRIGGTAYILDTLHIKWDECKKYVERRYGLILEDSQYHTVTDDQVKRIFEHTPPGTPDCPLKIVIDECHGTLNARDWADKSKRDLFDWCTQSRHDCNDLLFISQSALNIDKQLRRLATYVWRIRNTKTWGKNVITLWCSALKYLSFGLMNGGFFIVSQLDQDNKTLIGKKKWLEHDRDIFRCYDTRSMAGVRKRAGAAVCRLKLSKKRANRPWIRYAVGGVSVCLAITGCKVAKHMMGRDKRTPEKKVAATPTPSIAAYDVRVEAFRAKTSPTTLKTDHFFYAQGEMCPDGLVEAVRDEVARIRTPSGRYLFIITDYNGGAASGAATSGQRRAETSAPRQTPTPEAKSKEVVIAPDTGLFPPVTSVFPRDEHRQTDADLGARKQPTPPLYKH